MKSKTKGLFTPAEILHDKRLNSNEKYLLSVYWYYTINGKQHCCSLTNSDIQDELGISKTSMWRAKQHLIKLGLIRCNGGIKVWYKGFQNETIESQNETVEEFQNETTEFQNETHNKENKENKEINKENKENFLDDWEKQAILEKEEYKKNSLNNSTINNSCTVVDMVMGLPNNKEDVPINDEPENKNETDRNTILDTIAKKMVEKISYNIRIQSDELKHECDRQRFLEDNKFNELQLTKHIKEYIKDRDLTKIIQDVNVFNRFALNAFNSYKNGIKKAVTKLPKKNPYSDLEDSNSSNNDYKETNRWLNK